MEQHSVLVHEKVKIWQHFRAEVVEFGRVLRRVLNSDGRQNLSIFSIQNNIIQLQTHNYVNETVVYRYRKIILSWIWNWSRKFYLLNFSTFARCFVSVYTGSSLEARHLLLPVSAGHISSCCEHILSYVYTVNNNENNNEHNNEQSESIDVIS